MSGVVGKTGGTKRRLAGEAQTTATKEKGEGKRGVAA